MLTIKQHLLDNLKELACGQNMIMMCIKTHFEQDSPTHDDRMLKELISQYNDDKRIMARAIGNEETLELLMVVRKQFRRQEKLNQRLQNKTQTK